MMQVARGTPSGPPWDPTRPSMGPHLFHDAGVPWDRAHTYDMTWPHTQTSLCTSLARSGIYLNDPIELGLDAPPYVQTRETFGSVTNGPLLELSRGNEEWLEMKGHIAAQPAAQPLCEASRIGGNWDKSTRSGSVELLDRYVPFRCTWPDMPLASPGWALAQGDVLTVVGAHSAGPLYESTDEYEMGTTRAIVRIQRLAP